MVHVQLDCSLGGWILVPVSFRGLVVVMAPATILVDTSAMANFVNKVFVRTYPVCCVGFDGREGFGGLVTQDWAGHIQLATLDSKLFTLQSLFGVTFGLPWLDKQGWVVSGSVKGQHHFTLGSTPLYVINS